MKTGIYTDLSNEEYHADPAISASGLKVLVTKSPKHYKAEYIDRVVEKKTAVMDFGNAAHSFILEPDTFEEEYHVAPAGLRMDKRTKAYKDLQEDAGVKKVLPHVEYVKLLGMRESFHNHPLAPNILKAGEVETSHFAEDPVTGLMIRARPDIWVSEAPQIIADYKTTGTDIGVTYYEKHSFNMRRDIQAAFHKAVVELTTGEKVDQVLHIVQETAPPYDIRVFRLHGEWLENGEVDMRLALDRLKECIESGNFPGYESDIIDLELPGYAGYTHY